MTKKNEAEITGELVDKSAGTKEESVMKGAETPKTSIKYNVSINNNIAEKVKPVNPDKVESKVSEGKTKATNVKGLLQQIKEHPEVLKLIDKATLHKNNLQSYKKEDYIKGFVAFLGKTLKLMDVAIDFVTNKTPDKGGTKHNEVVEKARAPILFGVWVCIITFGVFGVWAAVAPLSSAAGAMGTVVVHTTKKTVQHKEGGIIEAIYVKDGDHVKAGQELIKLSPVELNAIIKSNEAQIESLDKQLTLVKEQVTNFESLFEKGLVAKSQLVELQLKQTHLEGNLIELRSKILAGKEQLGRLNITSPSDGIVNQLMVHTIGGVVRPGEPLMFIIPQDDNLVIDAMVEPKDIDSVHVGLIAKVNITAFRHRSTSPLKGTVVQVSPDVVEMNGGGGMSRPFYKVRIEVDKDQLTKISRLKNYELYPGMQAEVMIVTGQRTFLQYLLDPITNTFWHAFNEK